MAALRAHLLGRRRHRARAPADARARRARWRTQRASSTRFAARARETIDVPVAGRTHGMFAEPTTFGVKFALLCLQAERDRVRLAARPRGDRGRQALRRRRHVLGDRPGGRGTRLRSARARPRCPRPRCSLATATPRCSTRARRPRRRPRPSAPRCACSRAATWARSPSRSPRARRARRRCRTSATRSSPSGCAGSRGWSAATSCRASRTSRSGTSATSRTARSSASCSPTRSSSPASCCASAAALADGPRHRRGARAGEPRGRLASGSSSPSRCCSRSSTTGSTRDDAYRIVQRAAAAAARDARGRSARCSTRTPTCRSTPRELDAAFDLDRVLRAPRRGSSTRSTAL